MATANPAADAAIADEAARVDRYLSFRGYYGPGDGQYDLYAVDLTRCHMTRLTHQSNGTTSAWSPHGHQVAFSVPMQLDVINANGTGLRRVISSSARYTYGLDTPAWSVSDRLAYTFYLPPHARPEIYTINADGTSNTPLTHGAPGYAQPSWSPDGTSIAFTADPYSASTIEVASASGTGAHRVSPAAWTSYSPTWTREGKIVFLRQTRESTPNSYPLTSAYIVNPDGTGLRLLYPRLNASQITWEPGTLPTAICQPR